MKWKWKPRSRSRGRCIRGIPTSDGGGLAPERARRLDGSATSGLGFPMRLGPRLDGVRNLHNVMAWSLERRANFRGDRGRAEFVRRLAALADAQAWTVYAWALLPKHLDLLVRSVRKETSDTTPPSMLTDEY